ncbi:MAG: TetR/AcrR family transcriptional regulator [Chitinophagaceae bacterium]|jgi:AcrR family transcriptional regulator|nr:TetR/AcrR family transcriptional regulator [Chitinophagaceae bacterium]
MSAKTTDTKQEILSIARNLMKKVGYNAFSYSDISKQLNIKNAAVHYHYPTKEDLLADIVNTYIEDYKKLESGLSSSAMKAIDKISVFADRYAHLIEIQSICIIGSVASDFYTLPEAVKAKVVLLTNLVLGMVANVLEKGRANGELFFEEDARTKALLIMTNLAAGVQLARITGKKDFERIRTALLKQLKQ